jgi:very-short-patch-repair endonuclease
MPKRVILPAKLANRPFRYANGIESGIGEGRLRARDLERPFHGVRALQHREAANSSDLAVTLNACARFAPLLTADRFFSHETAARLWNCPLPTRPAAQTVTVSALAPHNAPRGRNVIGHRSGDPSVNLMERYGLPVSDPESTWLALASLLPVDELVACADHMVLDPYVLDPHDPRPYTTLHQLSVRLAAFSGRGARNARRALTLARIGSESRPETLLRLLLVWARIPEPRLNIDVTGRNGKVLGRGDLVWPEWHTVVEYDGDEHRTNTTQYDRDIRRVEDFVAADWKVVRVRQRGLFVMKADTIARVMSALRSGGWQPHASNGPKST